MKTDLVKHITKKISAVRFFAMLNKRNGEDDTVLKLKKEILHIKKHIVWIEDILDKMENK